MKNQNKIPDFKQMGQKLMQDLLIEAEQQGLEFIYRNFEKEGFMDSSFQAWQQRKTPIDYSLLKVTNSLFRSISAKNDGKSKVTFTADMPYAKLHNEGGYIKQKIIPTKKMRKFFWALYFKTDDEKYKFMAMAKEINRNFRVPKRQFMGDSKNFNERFYRYIAREILTRFKNIEQK